MKNYLTLDIGDQFLGPGHFLTNTTGFGSLVSVFVANAGVFAGIIFLFMIVFAGISIINGAGKGNAQSVAQGQAAATWAIVGMLVIFFGYFIVRLLQSIIGFDILGGNPNSPTRPTL